MKAAVTSQDIVRPQTEEEKELAAKRRRVAQLSHEVAGAELELNDLRIHLHRFESRFYRELGDRYVQLDELKARLAEKIARLAPEDSFRADQAREYRRQADQTEDDYEEYRRREPRKEEPPKPQKASGDARQLYRRIAACIHPDKAANEPDRQYQTRLMAELNEAYACGDVIRMNEIWETWKKHEKENRASTSALELKRLDQLIARLDQRLHWCRREMNRLHNSEMYDLMRRVEEAQAEGRDLLSQLARDLDEKIRFYRSELCKTS